VLISGLDDGDDDAGNRCTQEVLTSMQLGAVTRDVRLRKGYPLVPTFHLRAVTWHLERHHHHGQNGKEHCIHLCTLQLQNLQINYQGSQ
jgi:hypothetical protein